GIIGFLVYYRLHGAGALDRRMAGWREAGGWRGWIVSIIGGFSEGIQAIRTIPDLLFAIFYSAVHWLLVVFVFLWVMKAISVDFMYMNFAGAMLLLAVTLVGSVLQLPGVGGGVQVAAFVALTQIFGIEQEPAAAATFVLWLISFASPVLLGVPLLI